jgi:two-component system chemotaxis response regulator CheB
VDSSKCNGNVEFKQSRPDVMTLDVDMPGMNGLDVFIYIMAHHLIPFITISALTYEAAGVTLQGFERVAIKLYS